MVMMGPVLFDDRFLTLHPFPQALDFLSCAEARSQARIALVLGTQTVHRPGAGIHAEGSAKFLHSVPQAHYLFTESGVGADEGLRKVSGWGFPQPVQGFEVYGVSHESALYRTPVVPVVVGFVQPRLKGARGEHDLQRCLGLNVHLFKSCVGPL